MIKTKDDKGQLSAGTIASIVLHTGVILFVLHLVRPQAFNIIKPEKKPVVVQLQPPPPPPPPPKPIEPPKPPPPKPTPPTPRTPPPPQQLVTQAQTPVDAPSVPPPPPPQPPAPPAPPPPTKVVGTVVPAAYFNSLNGIIGSTLVYPPKSTRAGEEGMCKVRVTFARNGQIEDVQIIEKTGFVALDAECKAVFSRIGKFPPVAANANPEATDFAIELPINFTLSGE